MFTGIVEATAKILSTTDAGFTIERPPFFDDVKLGASINVSGVCLTIVELTDQSLRFDVIEETWNKTTFRSLKSGDHVNLERAMKADARLDGHIVQGHVEGVGVVVGVSSIPRPLPPGEEGETRHKRLGRNILYWMRGHRKNPIPAEAALWQLIRHDALGVRFRNQYSIDNHIFDFYCVDRKLAIEVDGGYHKKHKMVIQDHHRDEVLLQEHGIRTLRFTNEEVLNDSARVLVVIDEAVRQTPPPVEEGRGVEVTVRIPRHLTKAIAPKGSIALDGVSLTVADLQGDLCTVALIPHTLANTTLKNLKEGDRVNVETDILARTHAQK